MNEREMELMGKVLNAMKMVQRGECKRVDVAEGVKVYEVKNVIRVDFNTNLMNG